jgi:hypothetical protein
MAGSWSCDAACAGKLRIVAHGQHCTQRARRSPIRCTSSAGPPQTEQCAITGRKRTHRLAVSLGSDSLPSDTGALVITEFVAVRRIPAVTRGGPDRFSGFLLLPPPWPTTGLRHELVVRSYRPVNRADSAVDCLHVGC